MKRTWRMTAEQRGAVPTLYREGMTGAAIAERFGVSPTAIHYLLKRRGVTARSMSECHTRYAVQHDFFRTIETETQAYWLGFFFADGYIADAVGGSTVVTLTLGVQDRAHLEAFRRAVGAEHPIREYARGARNQHRCATLAFASAQMGGDLRQLGVLTPKHGRDRLPVVPEVLEHHCIRGLFDGDGCITVSPRGAAMVRMVGYDGYLRRVQSALMRACDLTQTKWAYRLGTPTLVYSGSRQALRIADYLYRDATIYLPRKKARFDALRHP